MIDAIANWHLILVHYTVALLSVSTTLCAIAALIKNRKISLANRLGIHDYRSDVLQNDKARIAQKYKGKGRMVTIVGDGINDATSLNSTHIGIAMGSRTDLTIEIALVTSVKGDLVKCVNAIELSRATMSNIKQNVFLAFIYGAPIAAGALYPFLAILLSHIFAAAAISLTSVSVIGNALRLNLKGVDL